MHVYIYSISICYTSDTESLDEAVSYLNVCDRKKKKKIERAYEFKSRDAMLTFVTGRLKRALHESKLIYVAQFIIEVIEFGYKLPFIHIPSPKVSRNNRSALTGKTQWTLRDLNYVLIRLVDYDDYTIKDDVFAYIDEAWGPHTIDRFIIARNLLG